MNARYVLVAAAAWLVAATSFIAMAFANHRPGDVVVIGGTMGLTGRYADSARRTLNGRELRVEEINARGGPLGHRVELKILDDTSDRRTAIELYQKLVTQGKVDLVIGPYSSAVTDAVANVMEVHKQPFISNGASNAVYERGRKYVFSLPLASAQNYQKGALHIAKELGVQRIAIIGAGELFPKKITEGAIAWAKQLGLEVVLLESYRKDQTEFAALLKRIEASGAEAVFSNGYYRPAVAQVRQLRDLNISLKLFAATVGPGSPKFVKELGNTAEYVLGFSQWEPKPMLGHPGIKEFIEHYKERYEVEPNYNASDGYAGMEVFEAAIKAAGSFDPEKIRAALASMELNTIKGPWKADAQGHSTIEGLVIQIQNGKRVVVWPKQMAEAKYILPMPKWKERPSN